MTYPTTYAEADALLTGRCKNSRKLGNNTYLERLAIGHAIRLHNTTVVLFSANGSVTLNSGGWKTVTTKDRMNKAGVRVYQEKFVWYIVDGFVGNPKTDTRFFNGITRSPEGVWT